VKLGRVTDGLRVVRDGLHEGDVIVVSGLQRVRPGVIVAPKKASMVAQPGSLSNASAQSALAGHEENPRESKARKE
jgi:hypothetical protein